MEIARQQPPRQALLKHPPPPTLCPASKLSQLKESLKSEHQLLRVSFEYYKKTIRANHRAVEKEVSSVISGVANVADSANLPKDDAISHLSSLISRFQGLKRKVLCEPKQWDFLVDQFKQEFCKLYGMTLKPLLNISYMRACLL